MPDSYDRELNLRAILITALGLALLLVVTAALMWPLFTSLRGLARAADPPPPVLPEAQLPLEPPGPRLQASPEKEMAAMRAEENHLLTSWEWVDEGAGVARLPIERAMELLAERGLPSSAEPQAEAVAEPTSEGGEGGS